MDLSANTVFDLINISRRIYCCCHLVKAKIQKYFFLRSFVNFLVQNLAIYLLNF